MTRKSSTTTSSETSSLSDGPSLYQLRILTALQGKKPGEVYAGTARNRPARRRLAKAKAMKKAWREVNLMIRSSHAGRAR